MPFLRASPAACFFARKMPFLRAPRQPVFCEKMPFLRALPRQPYFSQEKCLFLRVRPIFRKKNAFSA